MANIIRPAVRWKSFSAPPEVLLKHTEPGWEFRELDYAPGGTWDCIRALESGNNYNSPGGGAYQFEDATWQSLGGTGHAQDAPPAEQDARAVELQQRSGWSQWTTAPRCGR